MNLYKILPLDFQLFGSMSAQLPESFFLTETVFHERVTEIVNARRGFDSFSYPLSGSLPLHRSLIDSADILLDKSGDWCFNWLKILGAMKFESNPDEVCFMQDWACFTLEVLRGIREQKRMISRYNSRFTAQEKIQKSRCLVLAIAYALQEFDAVLDIAKRNGFMRSRFISESAVLVVKIFLAHKTLLERDDTAKPKFKSSDFMAYLDPDKLRWRICHWDPKTVLDVFVAITHTGLSAKEDLELFNLLFLKYRPVLSKVTKQYADEYLALVSNYLAKAQVYPWGVSKELVNSAVIWIIDPPDTTPAILRSQLQMNYSLEYALKLTGLIRQLHTGTPDDVTDADSLEDYLQSTMLKIIDAILTREDMSSFLPLVLNRYTAALMWSGADVSRGNEGEHVMLLMARVIATLSRNHGGIDLASVFFAKLFSQDLPSQAKMILSENPWAEPLIDIFESDNLRTWLSHIRKWMPDLDEPEKRAVFQGLSICSDMYFYEEDAAVLSLFRSLESCLSYGAKRHSKIRNAFAKEKEISLFLSHVFFDHLDRLKLTLGTDRFELVELDLMGADEADSDLFLQFAFRNSELSFDFRISKTRLDESALSFKMILLTNVLQRFLEIFDMKSLRPLLKEVEPGFIAELVRAGALCDCPLVEEILSPEP